MTEAFKAEEWRTDEQTSQKGSETPSPDFVSSISRGKPRRREGHANKPKPLQREALLNLPAGQQPSIAETYSHAGTIQKFLHDLRKERLTHPLLCLHCTQTHKILEQDLSTVRSSIESVLRFDWQSFKHKSRRVFESWVKKISALVVCGRFCPFTTWTYCFFDFRL